jgi:heme-degrading monooxygenase HmoA
MAIIQEHSYLTLINTFHVKPEDQKAMIDLLEKAIEKTIRHLPGFISANIHRALDGSKVANYSQWRNLDYFEAMQKNPEALAHIKEANHFCFKFEAVIYEVVSTREGELLDPPPAPNFLGTGDPGL